MSDRLPEFFYRLRENGASMYRVDGRTRNRSIAFEEIAVLNARKGEISPKGRARLSEAEQAAAEAWLAERRGVLAARDRAGVAECIERLNLTANWAEWRASGDELEAATDALLLAMHDLRGVLVRKRAARLAAEAEAPSKR